MSEEVKQGIVEVETIDVENDEDLEGIDFYEETKKRTRQVIKREVVKIPNPEAKQGFDAFLIQALNQQEKSIVNACRFSSDTIRDLAEKTNKGELSEDENPFAHMSEEEKGLGIARATTMTVYLGIKKPNYTLQEVEEMHPDYIQILFARLEALGQSSVNFRIPQVSESPDK